MQLNEFQAQVERTIPEEGSIDYTKTSPTEYERTKAVLNSLVALGELADIVKKQVYHQHGTDFYDLENGMDRLHPRIRRMALSMEDAEPKRFRDLTSVKSVKHHRDGLLLCSLLGLFGEIAETVSIIDNTPATELTEEQVAGIKKELGDVMWYVASTCSEIGITLEEVCEGNVQKVWKRYPEGFNKEASINREENNDTGIIEEGDRQVVADSQDSPLQPLQEDDLSVQGEDNGL